MPAPDLYLKWTKPMSRPSIERAPVFDILVNDRDEILLAIDARDGEPMTPMVIIEGAKVTLVRNETDGISLPDIPDELREKMSGKEEILVAETNDDGVVREYMAQVSNG